MSAGLPPVQAAYLCPLEWGHDEDARKASWVVRTKSIIAERYAWRRRVVQCRGSHVGASIVLGLCVSVCDMRPSTNIGTRPLFRNILVANDGSEGVCNTVVAAIELAQIYEAELHGMTVEEHLLLHQGLVICGELKPKAQAAESLQSAIIQAGLTATASRVRLTPHALAGQEDVHRSTPG